MTRALRFIGGVHCALRVPLLARFVTAQPHPPVTGLSGPGRGPQHEDLIPGLTLRCDRSDIRELMSVG